MPVKIELTTEESIISAPQPVDTNTYTVIPHKVIIQKVKEELALAGFNINKDLYRSTIHGNIAQGIYHLDYKSDPDMGLMFAWSNSYDKTQKFKCAIGSYVYVCGNGMTIGNMSSAVRKHTGTAREDAFQYIESQIRKAAEYYNELVEHKEKLKKINISRSTQAGIVGKLFADLEILTLTQIGIVKREMDKPSYNYNADPESAWCLYNHITAALKESHPTTWLDDHGKLHEFFVAEFHLSINNQGKLVPAATFKPVLLPEPEPVKTEEEEEVLQVVEPELIPEPVTEQIIQRPEAEIMEVFPARGVVFL